MALETVVYSQDPFSHYSFRDFYSLIGGVCSNQPEEQVFEQEDKPISIVGHDHDLHANWACSSGSPQREFAPESLILSSPATFGEAPATGRRKRRRSRSGKNKEELETQRMTHIAMERNRRKQMNDYLAVLRSLMPSSYVQRGDQASIIGGAINFVKELEQFLHSLERHRKCAGEDHRENGDERLAEFFTLPQYSRRANKAILDSPALGTAEIEVTMVDCHVSIKILAEKRPRLLVNLIAGLQSLGLVVLHLNVTTADQLVLYSLSVKIEEGSQLKSVDEIAASVNQMLVRIQDHPVY